MVSPDGVSARLSPAAPAFLYPTCSSSEAERVQCSALPALAFSERGFPLKPFCLWGMWLRRGLLGLPWAVCPLAASGIVRRRCLPQAQHTLEVLPLAAGQINPLMLAVVTDRPEPHPAAFNSTCPQVDSHFSPLLSSVGGVFTSQDVPCIQDLWVHNWRQFWGLHNSSLKPCLWPGAVATPVAPAAGAGAGRCTFQASLGTARPCLKVKGERGWDVARWCTAGLSARTSVEQSPPHCRPPRPSGPPALTWSSLPQLQGLSPAARFRHCHFLFICPQTK